MTFPGPSKTSMMDGRPSESSPIDANAPTSMELGSVVWIRIVSTARATHSVSSAFIGSYLAKTQTRPLLNSTLPILISVCRAGMGPRESVSANKIVNPTR